MHKSGSNVNNWKPTLQPLKARSLLADGVEAWKLARNSRTRIVIRIAANSADLYVFYCPCDFYTQWLLPCRHILRVDIELGLQSVPSEQVHFRWTKLHASEKLGIQR